MSLIRVNKLTSFCNFETYGVREQSTLDEDRKARRTEGFQSVLIIYYTNKINTSIMF